MIRRDFIAGLAGAAAAWPLGAPAQQSVAMRHIGVITVLPENERATISNMQQLRDALVALGWTDGKNIRFTYRYGGGNPERARAFAKALVELQPDLIVAHATPAAAALHQATRTQFVATLARPGGNITGFTNFEFSMGAKWLELLKEVAPETSRVSLMLSPDMGSYYTGYLRLVELLRCRMVCKRRWPRRATWTRLNASSQRSDVSPAGD
jgi:putative tryptophan/tyrosine transport system substrate-binding protein